MDNTILFASDTHFKYDPAEESEREKRSYFIRFLEECSGIERLYLLGDIFDFWFEYRHVIPSHFNDILGGIRRLSLSGTGVFMCGGNHDYWLGPYLTDHAGVTLLPQTVTHELHGLKVTLTHGDTVMPGDYGYKMLRAVIRSRAVMAAARLVHPDLLYSFAGRFSKASKGITGTRAREHAERVLAIAEDRLFREGNDAFIMGHIHLPVLKRVGGRIFAILGDWETHCSYLRLEGGNFTLERFQRDGKTLIENL